MKAVLIFPHQLFEHHPALEKNGKVILTEEWLFFKQYRFIQQKLVLHRASMQFYKDWLSAQGFDVDYIDSTQVESDVRNIGDYLKNRQIKELWVAELTDDWLLRRLKKALRNAGVQLHIASTPAFLTSMEEANAYYEHKKRYFQTDFYINQRKRLNLLVHENKPEGGQWSFDADNRLKYPAKQHPPKIEFPKENAYVKEAKAYVEKHFKDNYGNTELAVTKGFYPVNFEEAKSWLEDFLQTRFTDFGVYEDAMVSSEHFLHHSLLSLLLNTGLLTPAYVIERTMDYAAKHAIPLNSLEGFIRQIIGWREFIRIVYEREGRKQRTTHFMRFSRKIPASFYTGTTGIEPVDNVIKKVLLTGYAHHIERLMILGNFMLLCEFDADVVYKWFMELFIDAYDWVMVPNVYGMTQFTDGGLMVTKPYISSSNYVLKMSNYKKGAWCEIWDGLFWRFMHTHRTVFENNQRIGMLMKTWDKMDAVKKQAHLNNAEAFLQQLDRK